MRKDVFEGTRKYNCMDEIKPNITEVARKLNCNWRTAKKYIKNDKFEYKTREKIGSKVDAYKDLIKDKYTKYNATAMSIYKLLKTKGYEGGYSLVRDYVKSIKEEKPKKAVIRFETAPGEQAQVDWKEKLKLISKSGEMYEINILCVVLGYSRMRYYEITLSRNQTVLINGLINAFRYFGGIPKTILFDNMKTVIDTPKNKDSAEKVNSKFDQFAKDMGFIVRSCRSFRAQTKGKVESTVKVTNRLAPYNEEFDTIDQLKQILEEVIEDINNSISQAHDKIPSDLLEEEQKCMLKLPNDDILNSYIENKITRKVSIESCIQYKNNKYSVPTCYIGKEVWVKVENTSLEIYFNKTLIRSHEIIENEKRLIRYKIDDVVEILGSEVYKSQDIESLNKKAEETLNEYDKLIGRKK